MDEIRKEIEEELKKTTNQIFIDEVFVGDIDRRSKKMESKTILVIVILSSILMIIGHIFEKLAILNLISLLLILILVILLTITPTYFQRIVSKDKYVEYLTKKQNIDNRKKRLKLLKWEEENLKRKGGK